MNQIVVLMFLITCVLLAFQAHATRQLRRQNLKLEAIMATLEDTLALVEAQNTRVDSLIALTADLHQKVLDALGGGLTPSQQMRVDAVFDEVKTEADKVDAAITANTVQATVGAVSDGPSAKDIKDSIGGTEGANTGAPLLSGTADPVPLSGSVV